MRRGLSVLAACAALAGCGDSYDGVYAGGTGFMLVAVMELKGDTASIETVNTALRRVVATREFEAEIKSGKLHLVREDGMRFVYGLAADQESLECLSDSCQGFAGLGRNDMPRAWSPHRGG